MDYHLRDVFANKNRLLEQVKSQDAKRKVLWLSQNTCLPMFHKAQSPINPEKAERVWLGHSGGAYSLEGAQGLVHFGALAITHAAMGHVGSWVVADWLTSLFFGGMRLNDTGGIGDWDRPLAASEEKGVALLRARLGGRQG